MEIKSFEPNARRDYSVVRAKDGANRLKSSN